MKFYLAIIFGFLNHLVQAQSNLPFALIGTWKMENKEIYEHWDKLNENAMKGFTYHMKNNQPFITEYSDITREKKDILYRATVLHQNGGNSVPFTLTTMDKDFIQFENPKHDFPKTIAYKILSDSVLQVNLSDGKKMEITYKLIKQRGNQSTYKDTTVANPNYDPALAEQLGGDVFGMKSYILVILKTGTNDTADKAYINQCFRGHLDNMNTLVKEDKLIVAGPLGKNQKSYRGIFILNVKTVEQADQILMTDPAIQAKLLDYEVFPWYGSAALPKYLPYADKIWKKNP